MEPIHYYPPKFKVEVVKFANLLGQRRTSRLFEISQRRICEWVANIDKLVSAEIPPKSESPDASKIDSELASAEAYVDSAGTSTRPSVKSAKQVLDIEVEREVHDWVLARLPLKATSKEIRTKAHELYRSKGHETIKCSYGWYRRWLTRFGLTRNFYEDADPLVLTWVLEQFDNNETLTLSSLQSNAQSLIAPMRPSFVASAHWAHRFIKRNYILLNWEGRCEESLPSNLEGCVKEFRKELNGLISKHSFEKKGIVCLDEIPITFSSISTRETDSSETKSFVSRIGLRRPSIKDCEATVVIAIAADGTLLPPLVIVKAENSKDLNQTYPYTKNESEITVFYSSSTEPTTTSLLKWFELVLNKYMQQIPVSSSAEYASYDLLLLWDSFDLHQNEHLKRKCEEMKVLDLKFPPGTAAKLQPINAFCRLDFLKKMEEGWSSYVSKNSSKRKIVLPSTEEIVAWVYSAYIRIRQYKGELEEPFTTLGLLK